MDKIESKKEHRKEQKEQIRIDSKFQNKEIQKKKGKKSEWRKAVVYTINKICAGENASKDTSEELQEPEPKDTMCGETKQISLHRIIKAHIYYSL